MQKPFVSLSGAGHSVELAAGRGPGRGPGADASPGGHDGHQAAALTAWCLRLLCKLCLLAGSGTRSGDHPSPPVH